MIKKIAVAAALFTIGYLLLKQRKNLRGINKRITDKLGKSLVTGSMATLGATAPASPALPTIPLIPAI